MNRADLVERATAILADAYEEAAEMVALYMETHPSERLQTLCKEIDPDNWDALRWRVIRSQRARKASSDADSERARAVSDSRVRHARSAIREADPEQLQDIMRDLPVERRAAVVRAAVPPPDRTETPRTGPSFIELVVRVTTALIELESLVAGWQNLAAVPSDFSRDSFTDVVTKVLRIQDRFDELAAAVENEDEDEFMNIVRNFGATADVR